MHAHRPSEDEHRGLALLFLLALAQLMVILDISVVNVALPELSGDLQLPRGDVGWTVTSYSLAFGSLLLLGGRAAVLLGGVLTELVDWRAIFVINLPIGAGVALGAYALVPADRGRPRWRGLDARGALVATGSLAALVYALSQAADAGWASAQTLILGSVGVAGLAAFAVIERRTRTPLLNVARLGDRA